MPSPISILKSIEVVLKKILTVEFIFVASRVIHSLGRIDLSIDLNSPKDHKWDIRVRQNKKVRSRFLLQDQILVLDRLKDMANFFQNFKKFFGGGSADQRFFGQKKSKSEAEYLKICNLWILREKNLKLLIYRDNE